MIASDQGAKAYCSVLMINLHDNHEISVCISQVSIEAKSEKLCFEANNEWLIYSTCPIIPCGASPLEN
jgi:hypothetical protein